MVDRLTPAELEIMQVVWAHPGATVQEVADHLADGRAYTTVLTLLRILEQKGHVVSAKEGRRHLYTAVSPREAYEGVAVRAVVRDVFSGDAARLVRRLVEGGLDPAEREAIRRLLEES
jgi:predicted transcriptional regulator